MFHGPLASYGANPLSLASILVITAFANSGRQPPILVMKTYGTVLARFREKQLDSGMRSRVDTAYGAKWQFQNSSFRGLG